MTRVLTPAFETAVESETGEVIHLIKAEFDTCAYPDILYWTTGSVAILWDSQTWQAIGGALSWEAISEAGDDRAGGVPITLSGVDLSIISLLLSHKFRGRGVTIWRAHLNPTTGAVIADPYKVFKGLMNDKWEVTEQVADEGSTIDVKTRLVSRIALFRQLKGIRTNLASHQRHFSGDTFFQNVPILVGRKIYWGTPTGGN